MFVGDVKELGNVIRTGPVVWREASVPPVSNILKTFPLHKNKDFHSIARKIVTEFLSDVMCLVGMRQNSL